MNDIIPTHPESAVLEAFSSAYSSSSRSHPIDAFLAKSDGQLLKKYMVWKSSFSPSQTSLLEASLDQLAAQFVQLGIHDAGLVKCLEQTYGDVYPAQARTRKSFGLMTRKLSVT